MAFQNGCHYPRTAEALGEAAAQDTTSFSTDRSPVVGGSETVYASGTPISEVTDVSYTLDDVSGAVDVTNNTDNTYTITIDYEIDVPPFPGHQVRTAKLVDTSAEAGTGGGDLAIWDQPLVDQYAFISTIRMDQYTLEADIFTESEWLTPEWGSFKIVERAADTGGDTYAIFWKSKDGYGDLAFWQQSTTAKYSFVSSVRQSEWEDQSSYLIFDESEWLTPEWGTFPVIESVTRELPAFGVTSGHNVFEEVQITGDVYLYFPDSQDDPNATNPIYLGGATVSVEYDDDGTMITDAEASAGDGSYALNIVNPPAVVDFTVTHPHVIQSIQLEFTIEEAASLDIPIPVYTVYEGAGVDKQYGGRGRSQKMHVGAGGIRYG